MKDLLTFLYNIHIAACKLMLVPVISWLKGANLEDAYNDWKFHFIYKKFF